MKNISISLPEDQIAQLEAYVSVGDYASVSEAIEAALNAFLRPAHMPSQEQIDRDIAEYDAECARGDKMLSANEAFQPIIDNLGQ